MQFKEKFFISKKYGLKIRYLDSEYRSNTTIVVFPSGAEIATVIHNISPHLPTNMRIVSFDYPSRGKSSRYKGFDTIEMLAVVGKELIDEIQSPKYILLGLSFGTAVITKLATKIRGSNYRIILINPGEFFIYPIKLLLKVLFYPTFKSRKLRKEYKKIITEKLGILEKDEFPDDSLLNIDEQWYSILDYKIDTSKKIKIDTTIIHAKFEFIVDPFSKRKLDAIYEYSEKIEYNGIHILSYNKRKEMFKKVFGLLKKHHAY